MQEKFILEGNKGFGDHELLKYLSKLNCKKTYNAYLLKDKLIVNEFLSEALNDYISNEYIPIHNNDDIFFDKKSTFYFINYKKMRYFYNYKEKDIFKRYKGLGSAPFMLSRNDNYNFILSEYNPINVQYYRSDDSNAFKEYNEIFNIDISVYFPQNYMIKKYLYDKSILVKDEEGELAASFELDKVENYTVLLANFPKDQYILIFEKQEGLPTITKKIEYTINTKTNNIFQKIRPITINNIPIIGDYDEYGYLKNTFVDLLVDGSRMYKFPNNIPFTIRDCMYVEPTDCIDIVTEANNDYVIIRYIVPSDNIKINE